MLLVLMVHQEHLVLVGLVLLEHLVLVGLAEQLELVYLVLVEHLELEVLELPEQAVLAFQELQGLLVLVSAERLDKLGNLEFQEQTAHQEQAVHLEVLVEAGLQERLVRAVQVNLAQAEPLVKLERHLLVEQAVQAVL